MPTLSLTDFVDVVSSAGTPKSTKVKQVKHRGSYEPAKDFYRPFREHVIQLHQAGGGRAKVKDVLASITDAKKLTIYPELVDGYQKWWGRKKLHWFQPDHADYTASGVDVRVNPELGLEVNGVPHLIKLYLKADKLTKNRVDIITHLMATALSHPPGTVMSVLDVRNAKLFTPTVPHPSLHGILAAELAYVAALWPTL